MLFAFLLLAFPAQDAEVTALIQDLESDEPEVRAQAEFRLVELGLRSRPAILNAARKGDLETRGRAWRVLRSYPPEIRMEDLYEAGFRRETGEKVPHFAQRLWSQNPKAIAAAVSEIAPKASREDLRALRAVLEREEMHDLVRQTFMYVVKTRGDVELATVVLPLLRHPQRHVRDQALQALVASGAKAHASAILPLLGDPQSVHKALEALKKLSFPVPEDVVRQMLCSDDEQIRFTAVKLAQTHGASSFKTELIRALLQARAHQPWIVENAVARCRPTWEDLQPLFSSEHGPTRVAALRLTRRLKMPEAFEAGARLLDDPFEKARAAAVNTVVAWGGPEASSRAREGTGPGSLIALAQLKGATAIEKARQALTSHSPGMRVAALTALRELDAHDEAGKIKKLLLDPTPEVRKEAARVLPHLAGDEVESMIAARLKVEDDPNVQAQLLLGIAETGCKEAAPEVLRLLEESKGTVMWAAAKAAGSLKLQEAVPALVRNRAYEPLLQIQPKNLVALLRPLLKRPPKQGRDRDELELFGNWRERRERQEHNERILYLLYVSPPGADNFVAECLEGGIEPRSPVDMIRFHRAVEAFPWLINRIEAGSRWEVMGAGRLFASWNRRDLADRAVGWLSSTNEGARQAGVELLGGLVMKDKIPEIAALLDGARGETQWAAWSALSWIEGPETVKIFRKRLREGTPMHRANAALFLGRQMDVQSIPEIERLLEEDDGDVRETAAEALASLRATSSFDRVKRAFELGVGSNLKSWHWHLVNTGGARGRAIVMKDLDHTDLRVRENAMRAMGWGSGFLPKEIERAKAYLHDLAGC